MSTPSLKVFKPFGFESGLFFLKNTIKAASLGFSPQVLEGPGGLILYSSGCPEAKEDSKVTAPGTLTC